MKAFTTCRSLFVLLALLMVIAGLGSSTNASATLSATPAATPLATPLTTPSGQYTITSANTDPRVGPVTVDGPEEGQGFIAQCGKNGTLYQAYAIGVYPYTREYATDYAAECKADFRAPTAERGTRRQMNTDMRIGWVIAPNPAGIPTGWACAASGVGIGWNITGDLPNREIFPDESLCRHGM